MACGAEAEARWLLRDRRAEAAPAGGKPPSGAAAEDGVSAMLTRRRRERTTYPVGMSGGGALADAPFASAPASASLRRISSGEAALLPLLLPLGLLLEVESRAGAACLASAEAGAPE